MPYVTVDNTALHYEVQGAGGSAVLIPRCNFDWPALTVAALADNFTVVIVSPRGFGRSSRTTGLYTAGTIKSDVEAVLDHLGIDDYISFGYSFTGSVAPWLAHGNPRVRAVVSGGFPTATAYTKILPYITGALAEATASDRDESDVTEQFDPEAVAAWYREVNRFPAGGLIDALDCPIYSFWGADDEFIEELAGLDAQRTAMRTRELPFEVVPGQDHVGMLKSINEAMPPIREWLKTAI